MTDLDNNKIQANELVDNEMSTIKMNGEKVVSLTEQFNHGLLPDGWYYYKASDGRSDIATEYGLFCIEADNKVKVEVLAEVPTYEEWERLNWYAGNGVEENQTLKMENKQLKSEYEAECKRADELEDSYWKSEKENKKLKELLKECKRQFEEVELCRYDIADTDQEDWFKISTEQAGIANKMISKIDEVLK